MRYSTGYKYKLEELTRFKCPHLNNLWIDTPYIDIKYGCVFIYPGYAWDGASGPLPDTRRNLVPSLFHDAIYQLVREGRLKGSYRVWADEEFGRLCKEWGTWGWVADGYVAVLLQYGQNALEKGKPQFEVTL